MKKAFEKSLSLKGEEFVDSKVSKRCIYLLMSRGFYSPLKVRATFSFLATLRISSTAKLFFKKNIQNIFQNSQNEVNKRQENVPPKKGGIVSKERKVKIQSECS